VFALSLYRSKPIHPAFTERGECGQALVMSFTQIAESLNHLVSRLGGSGRNSHGADLPVG
jgi:hypothetical protein